MKILITAYASEPGAGSEYGVGWMVPTIMARYNVRHEIYVLTRSRCKDKIIKALEDLQLPNLHFMFYDISKWCTYPNEMHSGWGEQINYILWQLGAIRYVKKINKQIGFDIMHHLTFNQYRTPSPGFWLDIPFVMGPIGGAECIPDVFVQDLDERTRKKERIRRKGVDLKVFEYLVSKKKNRKVILCSCGENLHRLQPCGNGCDFRLLPSIAYDLKDLDNILNGSSNGVKAFNVEKTKIDDSKAFEMMYAGKALDWKGVKFFLNAAKLAFSDAEAKRDWCIKIIGVRFEEEQRNLKTWINQFGLEKHVELIPFVSRDELLRMMSRCSISVYPAFRDSGSMSVLEASALGCPTICLATGGQDVFPDDVLLKVSVKNTYEDTLHLFADKLQWAYEHEEETKNIGCRAQRWVSENLTWEKKVKDFINIYEDIVEKG